MRYATAAAFRAALDQRLKTEAAATGLGLSRLRKRVAFELFLRRVYKQAWNKHIKEPGSDAHRLSDLVADPVLLEELTADMRERGVGPAAQRKALVVLSAVLTAAVQWKKIPTNPVWRMPKPPGTPQRVARPFPPLVVERIRLRIQRRKTRRVDDQRPFGDSCLVILMSYAGLRPGEALALRWGDVGKQSLAVDKALADGRIGTTKTGVARSVPISLCRPRRLAHPLGSPLRRQARVPRPR